MFSYYRICLVGLAILVGGCGTSPISIVQTTSPEEVVGESKVSETQTDDQYVERWTWSYERRSPEAPIEKSGVVSEDRPIQKPPEKLKAPQEQGLTCPRFDLPNVKRLPELPTLDQNRRNDYKYIAGELVNHIENIIDHEQETQETYDDAYLEYLNQCK
jgi:hypothetical protein